MTYSIQFRNKVLKLQESGESFIKLSQRFKISPTTISRWKKKLSPCKHRSKKPLKIEYEVLKKDIEEKPARNASHSDAGGGIMAKLGKMVQYVINCCKE